MSWLETVIKQVSAYDTIADIRSIPAPLVSVIVFCQNGSDGRFYRWKLGLSGADDGDATLAPSTPADVNKGRWVKVAAAGGSGGTLAGDASGAASSNIVTHVTGTTNTKINSTTSVAAQVAGVDVATMDTTGMTLGSADVHYLHGAGAPTVSAPNGSQYNRTDGAAGSTLYIRVADAWVAK